MQVNRQIKGNPELDDVDHALGRPLDVNDTYRNYYATDCPDKLAKFESSEWWCVNRNPNGMTYCTVTRLGRAALANELMDTDKYGRIFVISRRHFEGESRISAKTRSKAKYAYFLKSDTDDSFMDFCRDMRVRLSNP